MLPATATSAAPRAAPPNQLKNPKTKQKMRLTLLFEAHQPIRILSFKLGIYEYNLTMWLLI